MQTIEEFMQSYFAERAELRRSLFTTRYTFSESFFTADYLAASHERCDVWAYERKNPAAVISIKTKTRRRLAVVTTSEPNFCRQVQYRYYLLVTEAGWRIDRKGEKCFHCDGTGYATALLAMGQIGGIGGCSYCGGLGWGYCQSDAD